MFLRELNFNEFKNLLENEKCIVIPIFDQTNIHYINHKLLCFFVYQFTNDKIQCFNINHPDLEKTNNPQLLTEIKPKELYCSDSKFLYRYWKNNIVDIDLYHWYRYGKITDVDNTNNKILLDHYLKFNNAGSLIPITKHHEFSKLKIDHFLNLYENDVERGCRTYFKRLYATLIEIEYNGLIWDENCLERGKIALKRKLIFGDYNIYTKTGRPSNTYNGINFLALNKRDGIRKNIVSRFSGGKIVVFDYDSFHVRLIANLLGIELPIGNIHENFGKLYFGKDNINEDEYKLSKQITFSQLYGDTIPEYKIPFFEEVEKYKAKLKNEFIESGYITVPINRKIYFDKDTSISKVFNYFIQALETYHSLSKLKEINDVLKNYESKIILYVYDSYIMDYNSKDGTKLLKDISDIMIKDNMNVHVDIGNNYHDMQRLNYPTL